MAKSRGAKISGPFLAVPHHIMRTEEFASISAQAVRLLLLVGMKYSGHNNGQLVATAKYLRPLGWRSGKNTTKCVRELLEAGLLVQTRIGLRPNRAAWYALGWRSLDVVEGMEIGPNEFRKFIGKPIGNAGLIPAARTRKRVIAPHGGNKETAAYTRRRAQSEQFLASAYTRVGKASRSLPSSEGNEQHDRTGEKGGRAQAQTRPTEHLHTQDRAGDL